MIETENVHILAGKYGEASMGGYTQSPGGFGSPAASQGGEKKGVSVPQLYNCVWDICEYTYIQYLYSDM